MTREEALNTLMKMRAWRAWGRSDQNENDRPEMPDQKEVDAAFDVCIELLQQSSLPSNLDEAAHHSAVMVLNNPAFLPNTPFSEILKILDGLFKAGAEWLAGHWWHDVTETPSIFGFYLVIHEKGWCVANYMGKGTVCESGWVEAIHHIEIEHPQKWLDLRDLIPKKQ